MWRSQLELSKKISEALLGVAASNGKLPSEGIIEEKYMITFTRYPNGKVFPKIFAIGKESKKKSLGRRKNRKEVKSSSLDKAEVY